MSQEQHHLKYKTRGNSTPQGKPKVYFCCHFDDFHRFFDDISDEILDSFNCSVWYLDKAYEERDEDFFNELLQMQLFVMPVTSKLMYTKNRALDIEFKFATEHHVPVIPIMLESDLEAVFNEKCGNMHFLDKNISDITAAPYEEKFKAALSSVLIGDQMAEKIRAAFAAYIFLSYRKKDRKYAQKLMRLIHKNEFCRDIAIWYDEFLTPGEDFNDAIKAALYKSDLIVMAVTPNLVNEKNYIMTTEYPMAVESGKPVLPVEMVKTDRKMLLEKYLRIPSPADSCDEESFNESLLSAVKELALKENERSPEHNFFIGLAYLGGVDVEVDHDKAFSLISASAECGLREAIEKLISMYENGEAVDRSYDMAAKWRERLILSSEAEYRNSPCEKALNTLFWDVTDCADAYYSLGKEQLAREKREYAKSLIEESGLAETSNVILRNLASCYMNLERYKEAFDILQRLFSETGTRQAKHDLAVAYKTMGIPGRSGANADKYRERAIELAEELVRETGSVRSRELLIEVCQFHAVMLKISGRLTFAREFYEKVLEESEALCREVDTLQSRRFLAVTYGLVAGMYKAEGNTDDMWKYYKKERDVLEALADKTDSVHEWRYCALHYLTIANEYSARGMDQEAIFYYERSIKIRERLLAVTDGTEYAKALCRTYESYGNFFKERANAERAAACYRMEIPVRRALAEKTDSESDYDELARCYIKLGEMSSDTSDFENALDIYDMLRKRYPEKPQYQSRYDRIKAVLG